MPGADAQRMEELQDLRKRLNAEFSDYESAVIFVCSLEAWFRYRWGAQGSDQPGRLREFDRFPDCGGLTPDFVAYFTTSYVLCGEYKKTFRRLPAAHDDIRQVVAYSNWRPPTRGDESEPTYDVLLVVHTHSDDVAGEEIARALREDQELSLGSPVVIVGYMPDTERVNGEWYSLKWRTQNNQRFSSPNVVPEGSGDDLNTLIVEADQCPIRRDVSAATISGRCPFVNDAPPPLYSAVRVFLPALSNLMEEDERDRLQAGVKVPVEFSLDDLLATEVLHDVAAPRGHVKAALEWLVRIGGAHRTGGEGRAAYSVVVDDRLINRAQDVLVDKAARHQIRETRERTRSRGPTGGQTSLW
jgi:hypothetical protein